MGQGALQSDALPAQQFRRLPRWLRMAGGDIYGWADERQHATRKAKRHPDMTADDQGAADAERRRRAAGSQRQTILSGALGPAHTGRSILSGG